MATAYEADITDLVKPHLEKAKKEGEEKGKQIGEERGIQIGEFRKSLLTARKMRDEGFSIDQIIRITGLSEDQLRENGII